MPGAGGHALDFPLDRQWPRRHLGPPVCQKTWFKVDQFNGGGSQGSTTVEPFLRHGVGRGEHRSDLDEPRACGYAEGNDRA